MLGVSAGFSQNSDTLGLGSVVHRFLFLVEQGLWGVNSSFTSVLFEFRDRTITLQEQVSWLIMPWILHAGTIAYVWRWNEPARFPEF